MHKQKKPRGFTIVELLIVIVVIAILAAVSVAAYNGIQQRARDVQRVQDVKTIAKALEMYYADHGEYPPGKCTTGCAINGDWSTTNDGSWVNLKNALVPEYMSALPSEPKPVGLNIHNPANYGYGYFASSAGIYCGTTTVSQMYLIVYQLEQSTQQQTTIGACPVSALSYGGKSNYRVVHSSL